MQPRDPPRLRDVALAGLVVVLTTVPSALSLTVLIFAGPLAPHLGVGVAVALFSGFVLGVVGALTSGHREMVVIVQDKTAVILAAAAAAVASEVARRDPTADPLPTVLALFVLATATTGAALWLLGRLRLGRLVRFIPFPVVAGFLGGTGVLLVAGGVAVMLRAPLAPAAMLAPDALARWLPGLVFGLALAWRMEVRPGKLVVPLALLLLSAAALAALALAGIPPSAAMQGGWLLGPLPAAVAWPPPLPSPGTIDLAALSHGLPHLGPLAVVAVLGMLLNISSAEAVLDRELDLDRELRGTGTANLAASVGAGLPGYMAITAVLLAHRLGVTGRMPALIGAAAFAALLVLGPAPLAFIPRAALGGLLVFLGVALALPTLQGGWRQLPRREFLLVLTLLVATVVWGFLAGVGLGLLVSVALFALDSSRVDIVKQRTTGAHLRSLRARASAQQAVLDARGGEIRILQLHGHVFFGSAHRLLTDLGRDLDDGAVIASLVVDFRLVVGVDCSAAATFARLHRRLQRHRVALVATGLAPALARALGLAGCLVDEIFADLDHGLERCEDRLLAAAGAAAEPDLAAEFAALAGDDTVLPRLLARCTAVALPAGAPVFAVGDPSDGLYLVASGVVTAWHDLGGGGRLRLRRMGAGTLIGESGLYLGGRRSATVVCDTPVHLHLLASATLVRLQAEDPALLADLHRTVARLLADRLVRTTAALQTSFSGHPGLR